MTEERRQEIIKNIHDYCVENIINFEAKASIAWDDMDHWRAPLSFVNSSFNDEIEEYGLEWFTENTTDVYNEESEDPSDVFYELFEDMEVFL